MIKIISIMIVANSFLMLQSCVNQSAPKQNNPVINQLQIGNCDNPDANINCCFVNMPSKLTNKMIIADQNEAGVRIIISGTIFKSDKKTPCPDVIMYSYQANKDGYQTKNGKETGIQKFHGHLHGWCRTDSDGKYQIETIRPGPYPDNSIPAHISAVIKKPNDNLPRNINDFLFTDDIYLSKDYIANLEMAIGPLGLVELKKNNDGIWVGTRDIVLW